MYHETRENNDTEPREKLGVEYERWMEQTDAERAYESYQIAEAHHREANKARIEAHKAWLKADSNYFKTLAKADRLFEEYNAKAKGKGAA